MNFGDQAVNYNIVYIDSNGIVQVSFNLNGENIVLVFFIIFDVISIFVIDILFVVVVVIYVSFLQIVDSYQLNFILEIQSKDE